MKSSFITSVILIALLNPRLGWNGMLVCFLASRLRRESWRSGQRLAKGECACHGESFDGMDGNAISLIPQVMD